MPTSKNNTAKPNVSGSWIDVAAAPPLRGCSFVAVCLAPLGCGIPTEEVLAEMRASQPPASYLVGTPKGRLTKYEERLLKEDWHQAREGVDVKLLTDEGEPTAGRQAA